MVEAGKSGFEAIDLFVDGSIIGDPYPYYEFIRSHGPVWWEPHHGVAVVTGFREALEVFRDDETFSSCNVSTGPFAGLSLEGAGDDITDLIEQQRHRLPLHEYMTTSDPPEHNKNRGLMSRMFTPLRLKQNEEFMWRLADRQLDSFVAGGRCEFIRDYSQPFTVLVIADLLGVPEADRERFREILASVPSAGTLGEDKPGEVRRGVFLLDEEFVRFIEDRRRSPRSDVLTGLVLARFPEGSTPAVIEVAREAAFLFVAGGETTARLLASAAQYLAEHADTQDLLRSERHLIPNFIEEMLRMQAPVKNVSRLARRSTRIADVHIPAGTTVLLLLSAINYDPDHFDKPQEFRCKRPNAQDHVGFTRGVHTCLGQSLARTESRVSLERILDRMGDIRISEAEHGPPRARRYNYDPSFIFRGLTELHLEFAP